jgi:serine/threonine-protein kinase RsbT
MKAYPTRYQKNRFDDLCNIAGELLGTVVGKVVIKTALQHLGIIATELKENQITSDIVDKIINRAGLYCKDDSKLKLLRNRLSDYVSLSPTDSEPSKSVIVQIKDENSIVEARSIARQMAIAVGFSATDQIKIATAVSEVARNIHHYAKKGTVTIVVETSYDSQKRKSAACIRVFAEDKGPGISNVEQVLSGNYKSKTGMGMGLLGCKNLMDEFKIQTDANRGTQVMMSKQRNAANAY